MNLRYPAIASEAKQSSTARRWMATRFALAMTGKRHGPEAKRDAA